MKSTKKKTSRRSKKKNLWELDGLKACDKIEKESNITDVIFSAFRCANCGKYIETTIEILAHSPPTTNDYAFSSIKTSKINMLVRRHNGCEEYFVFLCSKCALKNNSEE